MTKKIVGKFLHTFIDADDFIEQIRFAQEVIDPDDTSVHFRLNALVVEYTLVERRKILNDAWKGQATAEQIAAVNPPPEMMLKLNAAIGYHGIDRVIIYLYLHAWLKNHMSDSTMYTEALHYMDEIIADLNRVELPGMLDS